MYNSMADNHLSDGSLGRGGDDRFRLVDGEMSHVNKGEAKLIDVLGMQGEDIVQDIGSGTINPNTGMREYSIDPFAAAGTILAIGSAFEENRIQKNQWKSGIDAAEQGISDIGDQENLLDKVKDSRTNIAGMEYQKELIEIKAAAPAAPATTVVNSGGGGGGGPIIIRLEMDGDLLMEKIVNRINKFTEEKTGE